MEHYDNHPHDTDDTMTDPHDDADRPETRTCLCAACRTPGADTTGFDGRPYHDECAPTLTDA